MRKSPSSLGSKMTARNIPLSGSIDLKLAPGLESILMTTLFSNFYHFTQPLKTWFEIHCFYMTHQDS